MNETRSDNILLREMYLSRVRYSEQSKTLIISMSNGHVVLVKDFDVKTAKQQLNFESHMFASSVLSSYNRANGTFGTIYDTLTLPDALTRKTNRMEFLFEPSAGVSTSIQLDPSGRFSLIRKSNPASGFDECSVFDLQKSYKPSKQLRKNLELTCKFPFGPFSVDWGSILPVSPAEEEISHIEWSQNDSVVVKINRNNENNEKREKKDFVKKEEENFQQLKTMEELFPFRFISSFVSSGTGRGFIKVKTNQKRKKKEKKNKYKQMKKQTNKI